MKKVLFILLAIFIIITIIKLPPAAAEDKLEFSTDRSEYYFLVNQDAQLTVNITNPYDKDIEGIMSYTVTRRMQSQNSVMQSTNSNSQNFKLVKDQPFFGFNLGTSSNPGELSISLKFEYSDPDGKQMQTTLDGVKIYFVKDDEEQNQEQEEQEQDQGKKSKTKSQEELKEEYEKQQEELEKQRQQQQEEQMRQQQEANKLQNRMQNNQKYQDSSALKQEMQQQIQEQQQMQQDFKQALEQNQEFQQKMQEIFNKGFNQTGAELNPINSTSGEFKVDFQDKEGNNLTLEGEMENNGIKEMTEKRSINKENLMELIKSHPKYNEFEEQLANKGFEQQEWSFSEEDNATKVTISYQNKMNKTAEIQAIVKDDEVVEIKLVNGNDAMFAILMAIAIILLLIIIILFVYYKFRKKPEQEDEPKKKEKPFDYKKEARKLLEEAEKLFEKGEQKEAYSKASQAIRIYYSYKHGLNKEITNTEIIRFLRRKRFPYEQTQKCLNLCAMVEFAKYRANKQDFDNIIELGEEIIR